MLLSRLWAKHLNCFILCFPEWRKGNRAAAADWASSRPEFCRLCSGSFLWEYREDVCTSAVLWSDHLSQSPGRATKILELHRSSAEERNCEMTGKSNLVPVRIESCLISCCTKYFSTMKFEIAYSDLMRICCHTTMTVFSCLSAKFLTFIMVIFILHQE